MASHQMISGRGFPHPYHNNNTNNKYGAPDPYLYYPQSAQHSGPHPAMPCNNHPVLSKMEQRFAGGGKNNEDYLQNYSYNTASNNHGQAVSNGTNSK